MQANRESNGTATDLSLDLPVRKQPRTVRSATLRIAVEGPLRVGKSTLAQMLAEHCGASLLSEPENNPFLKGFYAGEAGMGFAAQMWFLRNRAEQLRTPQSFGTPVVSDYIIEKDKLYAYLNLSDEELGVYRGFYDAWTSELKRPDLVVYLRATPAVLRERLRRKGIASELELDREYLEQICAAYDHFFEQYEASRLLVVDTSAIDFVRNARERESLLDRILAPVHGREYFTPLTRTA